MSLISYLKGLLFGFFLWFTNLVFFTPSVDCMEKKVVDIVVKGAKAVVSNIPSDVD